jgi:hypothetical protein
MLPDRHPGRQTVVGAGAIGPIHGSHQSLGLALGLQVLPVGLLVADLVAHVDIGSTGANPAPFRWIELRENLARSNAGGIVLVAVVGSIKRTRATGVGRKPYDSGLLGLGKQTKFVLEAIVQAHPRSNAMKVGRFRRECLPVLPTVTKLDWDEDLVLALGEAEARPRMETLVRPGHGLNRRRA